MQSGVGGWGGGGGFFCIKGEIFVKIVSPTSLEKRSTKKERIFGANSYL